MNIVFSILKWLGLAVVLAIALLVILPWWPVLQDQFGKGEVEKYIEAQSQPIDLDADNTLMFDDGVYESRFIMLNEMHGFAMPQQLDLMLLQHFVDHGLKMVYLAEMDPAQALIVNHYLLSGDDTDLKRVFDSWAVQTAQWGNKEFFEKIKKIRAMNASLADDEKVLFVGVDAPQDEAIFEEMSQKLYESLAPGFDRPRAINSVNILLLEMMVEQQEELSRYGQIEKNISLVMDVSGVEGRTFYGLWGLFHGGKTTINGARPLAMRLNEGQGPLADQVSTISTVCVGSCRNMMPSAAVPGPMQAKNGEDYVLMPMVFDQKYLWRMRGIGEAKSVLGDHDALLIRTDGPDTPYADGSRLVGSSGYLSMMQKFVYGGGAADAMDYIIVMQSSAPLTPWAGTAYDMAK